MVSISIISLFSTELCTTYQIRHWESLYYVILKYGSNTTVSIAYINVSGDDFNVQLEATVCLHASQGACVWLHWPSRWLTWAKMMCTYNGKVPQWNNFILHSQYQGLQWSVGWNDSSIPKVQRCSHWSLRMNNFIPYVIGHVLTYPCWYQI